MHTSLIQPCSVVLSKDPAPSHWVSLRRNDQYRAASMQSPVARKATVLSALPTRRAAQDRHSTAQPTPASWCSRSRTSRVPFPGAVKADTQGLWAREAGRCEYCAGCPTPWRGAGGPVPPGSAADPGANPFVEGEGKGRCSRRGPRSQTSLVIWGFSGCGFEDRPSWERRHSKGTMARLPRFVSGVCHSRFSACEYVPEADGNVAHLCTSLEARWWPQGELATGAPGSLGYEALIKQRREPTQGSRVSRYSI